MYKMKLSFITVEEYFWIHVTEVLKNFVNHADRDTVFELKDILHDLNYVMLLCNSYGAIIPTTLRLKRLLEFLRYNSRSSIEYVIGKLCNCTRVAMNTICINYSYLDVPFKYKDIRLVNKGAHNRVDVYYNEYMNYKNRNITHIAVLHE